MDIASIIDAGTAPRLSHVVGTTEPPLLDLTIGEALDRIAVAYPDGDALVVPSQGVRWSWRELRDRADRVAASLLKLGLSPGDRIGILAPNCAEWLLVQLASAKAGLVLVALSPTCRPYELEHALNKVDCRALVTVSRFKDIDHLAVLGELGHGRLPSLEHIFVLGEDGGLSVRPFADLDGPAAPEMTRAAASRFSHRDPTAIQFTSGTTGLPKAATLSHHNIVNNAWLTGLTLGLTANDRICAPVPLYHCFGMVACNLVCVLHGATIVYPGAQFDPERVLETVARERCTVLYGVLTMFVAMLQHERLAAFDLSTLRTGIVAGAPCPETLFRRIVEEMHLPEMTVAYGMTETSPVSFQTERTDSLDLRASTVGTVHPHVEARIAGVDGAMTPVGASGEFCARGYCVMLGYWGDPDETAKVIDADGWMHTGDLAEIDEHGYCRIVGRIKDMIIRGGENIYPREIEDVLMRHLAVADAHVIGVPDARYGEEICAWIKLKAGREADPQAIQDFCKDRLAKHKTPRHIRFVLDYPKTASGKVQKSEMRRLMLEGASSVDEAASSASTIDDLVQAIRGIRLEP